MVCSRHPSSPPQTGEGQGPANLLEMAGRKRALTRQLLGALWRLASSLVATTAGVQSVVRRSRLQSRCLSSLNDGMAGVLGTRTSWTCMHKCQVESSWSSAEETSTDPWAGRLAPFLALAFRLPPLGPPWEKGQRLVFLSK